MTDRVKSIARDFTRRLIGIGLESINSLSCQFPEIEYQKRQSERVVFFEL